MRKPIDLDAHINILEHVSKEVEEKIGKLLEQNKQIRKKIKRLQNRKNRVTQLSFKE